MNKKNPERSLQDEAEVLIALAAQQSEAVEQPPSPDELVAFFANSEQFSEQRQDQILAYLDSNPEAYKRWIQYGRHAEQPKPAWSIFSMAPYALAACAAILLLGLVFLSRGKGFNLDNSIDNAYQTAVFSNNQEGFQNVMIALVDTLQQSERPLGFSQAGQSSDLSKAFMLGLRYDWQTLNKESPDSHDLTNVQQEDYQLGRWHTLLWTLSQQNIVMPKDFWLEQLTIVNHLQMHYAEQAEAVNTAEVGAITLQLKRMVPLLQQLVENSQTTKPYRQIEQVLAALLYSIVPQSDS